VRTKKEGVANHSLSRCFKAVTGYGLEGDTQTKTHGGEVWSFVTSEVVETFSEDAEAASGLKTDVKTATDLVGAVVVAVGSIATADEGVRGDAKAVDRSAQHEVTVELVVLLVGAVETVVHIDTDVTVEEVGVANTTAEGCVTALGDESTAEDVDGGTSVEAVTSSWRWCWWKLGSFWVFTGVGRAGDSASREDREGE
jgi:hypothetical protein